MSFKRFLGKTGIQVSAVGLGTVKFGRNQKVNYPAAFALPSDAELVALLSQAQEEGINLLDTAPAYGQSEERLGKLLKGKRHDWVISTKVGEAFVDGQSQFDFSPAALAKSIERSLQRLNTDYLDLVLVHSSGEDIKIIEQDGVFENLATLKKAGKLRAYGMSTKTTAGGLRAVKEADVVMVTYNPLHVVEQPIIAQAYQENKGIFIKKALASGHLDRLALECANQALGDLAEDPVKAALHFIFQQPGVSAVILGTINPLHLKHNVLCAKAVVE
jgi:aryl-alcohol dehydrogenase-like predicted oxidoreductase